MLTKNFSYAELACPCCSSLYMEELFLDSLQEIRDQMDRPMVINSGYRCRRHNLKIGGRLSSRHLIGAAVDISTRGWDPSDLHYLVFLLTSYHSEKHDYNTGIGIYKNHIHFDLRVDDEILWVDL